MRQVCQAVLPYFPLRPLGGGTGGHSHPGEEAKLGTRGLSLLGPLTASSVLAPSSHGGDHLSHHKTGGAGSVFNSV